jgi:hypothetical protein
MRKLLALFVAFISSGQCMAQVYVENTAKRSCECIEKITNQMTTAQVGICILKSISAADAASFQKDFHVDINDPAKDGSRIGAVIGPKMLIACPETMVRAASSTKVGQSGNLTGTITKIETDTFVIFSVKDTGGKQTKLFWLYPIEGNDGLPNSYQALMGKTVEAKYDVKDIFDPKIGEYRQFKVITYLK